MTAKRRTNHSDLPPARSRWRAIIRAVGSIHLRIGDYIVFLCAVAIIIAFSMMALGKVSPGVMVQVESVDGTFVYPLSEDRELAVAGPLGDSLIHIHDGAVYFVDSPCQDKICISVGSLRDVGQWAACLPNRVFVTIVGEADARGGIDATAF